MPPPAGHSRSSFSRLLSPDVNESSSSSNPGAPPPTVEAANDDDDDDGDDPVNAHHNDQISPGISFKRRQKAPSRYSLFSSAPSTSSTPTLLLPEPTYNSPYNGSRASLDQIAPVLHSNGSKDDSPTTNEPWSSETPGRRVYDDLTAIDWIFEYTKERVRKRALMRKPGLTGYFSRVMDSSQVWIVLIGTGLAAGMLAAGIDIVANWLGDLKEGYCRPSFYLSREFCCWGIDESDSCTDWVYWSQALKAGGSKGGSYVIEYLFYIIFSVVFAASASILVTNYAMYARHSGIPEIKTVLGGFVIRRFMGLWTLVVKSIGLCLAVASGLWLGKEGPLVHVACCCANLFMKLFYTLRKNEARILYIENLCSEPIIEDLERCCTSVTGILAAGDSRHRVKHTRKREVLSAAAAAGISVAFGSPIGGVLFSLEQLSYYFPDKTMWQSFVSAMVAAVTLQFCNPFRTGKLVLYQVKYTRGWHGFEIVPFAILGVLGGLYGAFFIKLNMRIATWRKTSIVRGFPVLEVIVVALLTALVNYPVIFMRPPSSVQVANLFQECSATQEDFLGLCKSGNQAGAIILLLFSSIVGILLSSVTFGLQIPAGIILPSMAIGALYGRAMGMVVQAWQRNHPNSWMFTSCEPDVECVTPGVFAIIGAASALGGVTRMTVSIVVIMFELTGALTYVLPIMIAVMISKWVGDAFGKRGIYESWIQFKEYPFLDNRDNEPVPDVPVETLMTRIEDLVVITETGHTIDSLEQLLNSQGYKGFPVVSDTRQAGLVGYISRSELRFALDQARHTRSLAGSAECFFSPPTTTHAFTPEEGEYVDLGPWMDSTPITLSPAASLGLATSLFQKLGLRYLLFVRFGLLQGLLTKKDVFFVLNGAGEEDGEAGGIGIRGLPRDDIGRERLLGGEVSDAESINGEAGLLGGT